jgi:hypothetical protein
LYSIQDPDTPAFELLLTTASISHNTAVSGGGMYIQGGITTIQEAVQIYNNTATQNAGGLYVGGGMVDLQAGSTVSHNNASQAGGIGWYTTCSDLSACGNSTLLVSCDAAVKNNKAKVAGGGVMIDVVESQIEGYNDTCVTQAAARHNNSASFGDSDVFIVRTVCRAGEVSKGGWCDKCPKDMFAFDPLATDCSVCPEGALCPGGNVVLPQLGFWHSQEYSTQFHKCPYEAACSNLENASHASDMNEQCAEGYQGNACGKCSAGYGLGSPFHCRRCMSKQSTIALYALGYVCLLLLVTFMAHTTWDDNRSAHVDLRMSDVLKVIVLFGWYLIILASVRIEWPKSLSAIFAAVS